MGITATFVALYQAYLICYMMMMMMITIVIIILSLNRDFLGQKIVWEERFGQTAHVAKV